MTLTPDRVFEAAPFSRDHRRELEESLTEDCFDAEFSVVVRLAWAQIYKWYKWECEEIGARRAFWGVVYRLVDNPTHEHIEYIKGQLSRDYSEFAFGDPTKETSREELLKRLEFSFFV